MKQIIFTLLASSLIMVSGCSKENSKKWIVADIAVQSALDNSPVKCRVEIEYTVNGIFGSFTKKEELGETDENGRKVIELSVNRKTSGHRLNIYAFQPGYAMPHHYISNMPVKVVPLSHQGKNNKIIYLSPVYHYALSIKNINCYNQQDSLWINSWTQPYVGCIDIDNSDSLHITHFSEKAEVKHNLKIKRNGVVTTAQHSFTLQHETLNHVLIEY